MPVRAKVTKSLPEQYECREEAEADGDHESSAATGELVVELSPRAILVTLAAGLFLSPVLGGLYLDEDGVAAEVSVTNVRPQRLPKGDIQHGLF